MKMFSEQDMTTYTFTVVHKKVQNNLFVSIKRLKFAPNFKNPGK